MAGFKNIAEPKGKASKPVAHVQRETNDKSSMSEASMNNMPFISGLTGGNIQAKLTVGAPNDKFEVEADSMADQVMRMPAPTSFSDGFAQSPANYSISSLPAVQKKCTACENESLEKEDSVSPALQMKEIVQRASVDDVNIQSKSTDSFTSSTRPSEAKKMIPTIQPNRDSGRRINRKVEEEDLIQKTENQTSGRGPPQGDFSSKLNQTKGSGQPLDSDTNSFMSNRFGADFSNVRIHDNSTAASMSDSISAKAFTHQNNIYFNQGQYQPNTSAGKHLLAHELTHTIQQGAVGTSVQPKLEIGSPTSALEKEADSMADKVMRKPLVSANSSFIQPKSRFNHAPSVQLATWDKEEQYNPYLANTAQNSVQRKNKRGPPNAISSDNSGKIRRGFWDDPLGSIGRGISSAVNFVGDSLSAGIDWVKGKLREMALNMPGYNLFTVVIGKDPITGQTVERTGMNFINAGLEVIPNGADYKRKLQESGGLQRAADWIDAQMQLLDFTVGDVLRDFGRFVSGISLSDIASPGDVLTRGINVFRPYVTRIFTFAGNVARKLLELVKEYVVTALRTWIQTQAPFYPLLTVVLGEDPITGQAVERNGMNILRGFIRLHPNGEAQLAQMQESGSLQSAATWIDQAIVRVSNIMTGLKNGFITLWSTFTITQLLEPIATFNRIYTLFSNPVSQLIAFAVEVATMIIKFIKDALIARLVTYAKTIPGYNLVTVILGKDIFSQEPVERSTVNIIRGFMGLVPGGEEKFQELNQTGAITEAATWIEGAIAELNLTWAAIRGIFTTAWESFSLSDIAHPIQTFTRVLELFGPPIARIMRFVGRVVIKLIEIALRIMGFPFALIGSIISNAQAAYNEIKNDPIKFLKNLLKAVKQGFVQFFGNILGHLVNGVGEWLFGQLGDAGITIPPDFSFQSILGMVFQILGITKEKIFDKLKQKVGPERWARIEGTINQMTGVWSFLSDIFTRGPIAIWEKIQEKLTGLWDTVVSAARGWIMTKIIEQVTVKLLSFLDPTGIMAVVNSFIAFFRAIQSAIQYMIPMLEMLNSFLGGIVQIAQGNIQPAADLLERTMARGMPILIGFLANQVGLGRIGDKIKEVIESIQAKVDEGLQWVIDKAWEIGGRLLEMGRNAVGTVRDAIGGLFGLKKRFTNRLGENHELSFRQNGNNNDLWLASETPGPIPVWIGKLDPAARAKDEVRRVESKYSEIMSLQREYTSESLKPTPDPAKIRSSEDLIQTKLGELSLLLEPAGFFKGSEDLPLTNVTFEMAGGKAKRVKVDPLTIHAGNTVGQEASSATGDRSPNYWTEINQQFNNGIPKVISAENFLQKDQERYVSEVVELKNESGDWVIYYEKINGVKQELPVMKKSIVRAHLLNNHLHGPAEKWNLAPASFSYNTVMNGAEEQLKRMIRSDKPILSLEIEANYWPSGDLKDASDNTLKILNKDMFVQSIQFKNVKHAASKSDPMVWTDAPREGLSITGDSEVPSMKIGNSDYKEIAKRVWVKRVQAYPNDRPISDFTLIMNQGRFPFTQAEIIEIVSNGGRVYNPQVNDRDQILSAVRTIIGTSPGMDLATIYNQLSPEIKANLISDNLRRRYLTEQNGFEKPSRGLFRIKTSSPTTPPVSPKLKVGSPSDPLEAEADQMADRVMRMPIANSKTGRSGERVQRKCSACEQEKLQRAEVDNVSPQTVEPSFQTKLDLSKPTGRPMDENTQAFMGERFGTNFENVSIHADGNAAALSNQIQAKAFTTGNHIYFNRGEYQPETSAGKRLLAHELTHTIQQGAVQDKAQRKCAKCDENEVKRSIVKKDEFVQKETLNLPTEPVEIQKPNEVIELKGGLIVSVAMIEWLQAQAGYAGTVAVKFGSLAAGNIDVKLRDKKSEKLSTIDNSQAIVINIAALNPLKKHGIIPAVSVILKDNQLTGSVGILTVEHQFFGPEKIFSWIQENTAKFGLDGVEIMPGVSAKSITSSLDPSSFTFGIANIPIRLGGFLNGVFNCSLVNDILTFSVDATVQLPLLDPTELHLKRDDTGKLSGHISTGFNIQKLNGIVEIKYNAGIVDIKGEIAYKDEQFDGKLSIVLTDYETAMNLAFSQLEPSEIAALSKIVTDSNKAGERALVGFGMVNFALNDQFKGRIKVILDGEGYITVIGKLSPETEIPLFDTIKPDKEYDKPLLDYRIQYGIPLLASIGIGIKMGVFANWMVNPATLRNLYVEGVYSTNPKLENNRYTIGGNLNVSAMAEAGLYLTIFGFGALLGHEIFLGLQLKAFAKIEGYLDAGLILGKREALENPEKSEYFINGTVLMAALPSVELSSAFIIQLDSPWWSPVPDNKWEWPLASHYFPVSEEIGLEMDIDHVIGSKSLPTVNFKPHSFDPAFFLDTVTEDVDSLSANNGDTQMNSEFREKTSPGTNQEKPLKGKKNKKVNADDKPSEQELAAYKEAVDKANSLDTTVGSMSVETAYERIEILKRMPYVRDIKLFKKYDTKHFVYIETERTNNRLMAEPVYWDVDENNSFESGDNLGKQDLTIRKRKVEELELLYLKENMSLANGILFEQQVKFIQGSYLALFKGDIFNFDRSGKNWVFNFGLRYFDFARPLESKIDMQRSVSMVSKAKTPNWEDFLLKGRGMKKSFIDVGGNPHEVYFKMNGRNLDMQMASANPGDIENKIKTELEGPSSGSAGEKATLKVALKQIDEFENKMEALFQKDVPENSEQTQMLVNIGNSALDVTINLLLAGKYGDIPTVEIIEEPTAPSPTDVEFELPKLVDPRSHVKDPPKTNTTKPIVNKPETPLKVNEGDKIIEDPISADTAHKLASIATALNHTDFTSNTVSIPGGHTDTVGIGMNTQYLTNHPSKIGQGSDNTGSVQKNIYGFGKIPTRGAFGKGGGYQQDMVYIKGHLLNGNVGGPAADNNLYPITGQANSDHKNKVENGVKTLVLKDRVMVYYKVTVNEKPERTLVDVTGDGTCLYYALDCDYMCAYSTYKLYHSGKIEKNNIKSETIKSRFNFTGFVSEINNRNCPQRKSTDVSGALSMHEQEADSIARKSLNNSVIGPVNPDFESKLNATKSTGQSMDSATKSEMETGFGANFENVNIHTGADAASLSNQIQAKAFTKGNDIYFNQGQYNPTSKEGKHLLAHELTHTLQQGASPSKSGLNTTLQRAPNDEERPQQLTYITSKVNGKYGGKVLLTTNLGNYTGLLSKISCAKVGGPYTVQHLKGVAIGKTELPSSCEFSSSYRYVGKGPQSWVDLDDFTYVLYIKGVDVPENDILLTDEEVKETSDAATTAGTGIAETSKTALDSAFSGAGVGPSDSDGFSGIEPSKEDSALMDASAKNAVDLQGQTIELDEAMQKAYKELKDKLPEAAEAFKPIDFTQLPLLNESFMLEGLLMGAGTESDEIKIQGQELIYNMSTIRELIADEINWIVIEMAAGVAVSAILAYFTVGASLALNAVRAGMLIRRLNKLRILIDKIVNAYNAYENIKSAFDSVQAIATTFIEFREGFQELKGKYDVLKEKMDKLESLTEEEAYAMELAEFELISAIQLQIEPGGKLENLLEFMIIPEDADLGEVMMNIPAGIGAMSDMLSLYSPGRKPDLKYATELMKKGFRTGKLLYPFVGFVALSVNEKIDSIKADNTLTADFSDLLSVLGAGHKSRKSKLGSKSSRKKESKDKMDSVKKKKPEKPAAVIEKEKTAKKAEEDAAKKKTDDDEAKKKLEDDKKKSEDDVAKKKLEEEEAKKKADEDPVKKKADEEAAKQKAEEEAKKNAEEEENTPAKKAERERDDLWLKLTTELNGDFATAAMTTAVTHNKIAGPPVINTLNKAIYKPVKGTKDTDDYTPTPYSIRFTLRRKDKPLIKYVKETRNMLHFARNQSGFKHYFKPMDLVTLITSTGAVGVTTAREMSDYWLNNNYRGKPLMQVLRSNASDPKATYTFYHQGGLRGVPKHSRREVYGFASNVKKDSSDGLKVMKKGFTTAAWDETKNTTTFQDAENAAGKKYDKADLDGDKKLLETITLFQNARWKNGKIGKSDLKQPFFGWEPAIMGHDDSKHAGASGYWNDHGNKDTRDGNMTWNKNPDNYWGPEHTTDSSASGSLAPEYEDPTKDSNPMWWNSSLLAWPGHKMPDYKIELTGT